jgi:hypothetical protein
VLRFVEAEESGKYTLSDSKLFSSVSGMSGYKMQKREEETPPKAYEECWNCGKKHKQMRLGGNCPAKGTKFDYCDRFGHTKGRRTQRRRKTRKVKNPT